MEDRVRLPVLFLVAIPGSRLKRTTRIPVYVINRATNHSSPKYVTATAFKAKSEQRWTILSLASFCGALLRIILHLVVTFSTTKPNGPDSHTQNRLVQSLPSQAIPQNEASPTRRNPMSTSPIERSSDCLRRPEKQRIFFKGSS
jgi:hypothetical protein